MQSAEFHLIHSTEELVRLAPAWRTLWSRDPNAKPFQAPEWLLPWWRHFGTDELCSVVIADRNELVGFLPFYVYWDAQKHERQLLPIGVGTTDYLDGIFAPGCSDLAIVHALEFMRHRVDHHRICVPQLPVESRLLAAVTHARCANLFLAHSEPCSRMAAVGMAELPQKIRRNAMYYRNRAHRQGTLELTFADESNWQSIFGELRRLHTSRWQSRGEQGVLVDERVVAWHEEAIPLLLRTGLLRLAALRLNHQTIAVLHSLIDPQRDGRIQYFYITAYSPDHAELRPGTLLIAYAVDQAAREGVTTIDMLRGDEPYKEMWHMQRVATSCLTAFPAASAVDRNATESAA